MVYAVSALAFLLDPRIHPLCSVIHTQISQHKYNNVKSCRVNVESGKWIHTTHTHTLTQTLPEESLRSICRRRNDVAWTCMCVIVHVNVGQHHHFGLRQMCKSLVVAFTVPYDMAKTCSETHSIDVYITHMFGVPKFCSSLIYAAHSWSHTHTTSCKWGSSAYRKVLFWCRCTEVCKAQPLARFIRKRMMRRVRLTRSQPNLKGIPFECALTQKCEAANRSSSFCSRGLRCWPVLRSCLTFCGLVCIISFSTIRIYHHLVLRAGSTISIVLLCSTSVTSRVEKQREMQHVKRVVIGYHPALPFSAVEKFP